jgi:N-methylhydantoinase B
MSGLSAVGLEVFRHAIAGVAEEMGVALRRAAYSPNIKERADCSEAVFDPAGEMVAQAEHIPVHLGSMPPASALSSMPTAGWSPACRSASTTRTWAAPICRT